MTLRGGAQTLDIIAAFTADNPEINHEAIARGRTKAVEMLKEAATLEAVQEGSVLAVRVINEGGHKLPTGHIEGRRVWTHVSFADAGVRSSGRSGTTTRRRRSSMRSGRGFTRCMWG